MTQQEQRTLLLTPAAQIKTRRQKWLWQNRVPMGTPTIFAGMGGEGKSTFALHLAARGIKGELEGDLYGQGMNVLIISHEDDWGTVMNPRLLAQGANLNNVYKLSVAWVEEELSGETVPALPLDLNLIRQAVDETGARLIIIDPITSTMGGDLNKVSDVRRALDPLAQLAQELDFAIIAIMHFNKGSGNVSNKLSGEHGFRDAVRSAITRKASEVADIWATGNQAEARNAAEAAAHELARWLTPEQRELNTTDTQKSRDSVEAAVNAAFNN